MITIRSRLKKIRIDTERLKHDAQELLHHLCYHDFDLGILVTTPATIQHYNQKYRNKNTATDVLSFPYHTALKAGQTIDIKKPEDKNLGDIIMCPEYVQKNLSRYNTDDIYTALQILLAHSIAHLIGYTHDTDEHYKQMQKKEKELLSVIKKPR